MRLVRRYCWGRGRGGICPADMLLGVSDSDVTPGARELCCLVGIGQDFAQGTLDLKKIGGLSVSKERLRQIVEGEARRVRKQRDSGTLPAAWSALSLQQSEGVVPRLYCGVDGVMSPTVTQIEKDKRRQKHIARRQQRGQTGVGNLKPLPPIKPGSDEGFKEMKIGLFYDQDKTHRHVLATEQVSKDFAPLLSGYAKQIGFERAGQSIALFDGAIWIYQQVCLALLSLQVILLDFFHLAEHVHATARCCLGEGEAARTWAGDRLSELKRSEVASVLAALTLVEKRVRSPAKKQSLRGLRKYLEQRRAMLDYARAIREGWDIGSGPTEATCKTLTLRLKRPGMKWDRDNAAAMMNLTALRESGQWDAHFNPQHRQAA